MTRVNAGLRSCDGERLSCSATGGGVRSGVVAENPIERLITRLNLAPRPVVETQMAFTLARLITVGTKMAG